MNILLVDDVESNLGVLSLLLEEWFEDNDIDDDKYTFTNAYNGKEALEKVQETKFDIIFLDIMMPVMDGLEALQKIRDLQLDYEPVIIMATALGDTKVKQDAKRLKANAYITKPIKAQMIEVMLSRYVDKSALLEDKTDDDFMEFDDFDDFDDFGDENTNAEKNMMNSLNQTHQSMNAKDFLAQFSDVEIDLEEIHEIEEYLHKVIYNLEHITCLESYKDELLESFEKYKTFLNTFSEFYEIYTIITNLITMIQTSDLSTVKNQKYIMGFLVALISDLIEWQNHIFIKEDASDICYMNASILNSYIQLKNIINN